MKITVIVVALVILNCIDMSLMSLTEWSPVGKPYTFTCYYDKERLAALTWRDDSRSLFRCIVNNIPNCDASDENISLYYKANMTSNGSQCTSSFTILNVPLLPYITSWACQFVLANLTSSTNKKYTLSAFAPAKTPICDYLHPVNETKIQLHCSTDLVFPPAICSFYVNTNSTEDREITEGSISYTNQPSRTIGYNKTDCTLTVSVFFFGKGMHVISVVMHANITTTITDEMKSHGQYKNILIGSPQAKLEDDCYVKIKENENRICTCSDVSNTILTPIFTWMVGNETIEKDRKLNKPSSSLEGKIITCMIRNILNLTDSITYNVSHNYYFPDDSKSEFIAIGAGIGTGILLLAALIILILFILNKDGCLIKTRLRSKNEKYIDNAALYYSQDSTSSSNEKHQDYKDIIPTIQSASDPPKNFIRLGKK